MVKWHLGLILCPLFLSSAVAVSPVEFKAGTISQSRINCPFDINFQFSDDLKNLAVQYKSTTNALVEIGANETEAYHECIAWHRFEFRAHNGTGDRNKNMTLTIAAAEMQGTVSLDEGVLADIETTIFWNNDARLQNFTSNVINGPTPSSNGTQPFSTKLNNPSAYEGPCSGVLTAFATVMVKSTFSLRKQGNGVQNSSGRLGPNLSTNFDIEWSSKCEYDGRCFYDRAGYHWCPTT